MISIKLSLFYTALVSCGCLCDNLVQLAEKLGANTLVQFVKDAGLADTLANGGIYKLKMNSFLIFTNICILNRTDQTNIQSFQWKIIIDYWHM